MTSRVPEPLPVDTERVIRALKEEWRWLKEWRRPFELIHALELGMTYCNEHYLRSALGYKPPWQFEQEYHTSHGTQFTAA